VFFRKKGKYTDVEGYNRISRLIEDRQREMSDSPDDQTDFDDDGVLLTREPAPRERSGLRMPEEPPASSSAVRPIYRTNDETAPQNVTEDRKVPFQADAVTDIRRQPEPETTPIEPVVQAAAPLFQPSGAFDKTNGCIVAAEASWEGKLSTAGDIRVDGTITGEIETTGTLYVSEKARVDGTIHARSLIIAGEVEGQVACSERLEILSGGTARGEIQTASLIVHEGAFIDSRFQMTKAAPSTHG
jgi:cytoskeletal protein CcmA (bactofilin family)